ncbi:hypothetical protein C0J52_01552 [Blattella germanica]|nr:hypothetical protein C0J52_01552 [Blattella germanica]
MQAKYQTSPIPSRSPSSLSSSIRAGSPLPVPVAYRLDCMTAAAKRYKYLRRLVKFQQMDFEFAFWQINKVTIRTRRPSISGAVKLLAFFVCRLCLSIETWFLGLCQVSPVRDIRRLHWSRTPHSNNILRPMSAHPPQNASPVVPADCAAPHLHSDGGDWVERESDCDGLLQVPSIMIAPLFHSILAIIVPW